jgi:hypothetical protein
MLSRNKQRSKEGNTTQNKDGDQSALIDLRAKSIV